MLVELVVYTLLDIWPYATYYMEPLNSFDAVTAVRVTMLALSGLVIPLVMPRPFRPSTPDAKPSIEDTASILSFYTFSFLDHIVFLANKAGNITPDDMPELMEKDKIEHVGKRALPILGEGRKKKRHVALSVAMIYSELLEEFWNSSLLMSRREMAAAGHSVGVIGIARTVWWTFWPEEST